MRTAFTDQLLKLASDPKIMLITGDLGFGVFDNYEKQFPQQYLNVGVAEQNMTGVAAGLALEGRIVFTYSIGNFPTLRCLEQIRNNICYHGANVNIVTVGGGFSYGSLGFSHHATEDLAILRALPEMTVVAPGDQWETAQATIALTNKKGAGYLRLDKSTAGYTNKEGEVFELGKGRTLKDGSDITLVSTGGILATTLKASELLAEKGIKARVISMHTLKPFDSQIIFKAAKETAGIITIEEHSIQGGLGSLVAEHCMEAGIIPKAFYRIGLRSGFSTIVGSQEYLKKCYSMDESAITQKALEILKVS